MKEIVNDLPITREVWDRQSAKATFADLSEHYKVEIIEEIIPEDEGLASTAKAIGLMCAADPIYQAQVNCQLPSNLQAWQEPTGAATQTTKC